MKQSFVVSFVVLLSAMTLLAQDAAPPAPPVTIEHTQNNLGLIWQNWRANQEGKQKFMTRGQIEQAIEHHVLLPLHNNSVNASRVKPVFRYGLKETLEALNAAALKFQRQFHHTLPLSSMLRDERKQASLSGYHWVGRGRHRRRVRNNLNAAQPDGPLASLHLRGMAFDIPRSALTTEEAQWITDYFLEYEILRWLDITEEKKIDTPHCFHITVFGTYGNKDPLIEQLLQTPIP